MAGHLRQRTGDILRLDQQEEGRALARGLLHAHGPDTMDPRDLVGTLGALLGDHQATGLGPCAEQPGDEDLAHGARADDPDHRDVPDGSGSGVRGSSSAWIVGATRRTTFSSLA